MKCTRLERVDTVHCSCYHHSLTYRTLACATCLKGMDGLLWIDPNPFVRYDSLENDQLAVHAETGN